MRMVACLVVLLLACGPTKVEPEEPVWNKQACAECMMLLSDRRTAAQAQLPDGTHVFFDDFGCLVQWLSRPPELPRGTWVRAPSGSGWVDASKAYYSEGHMTPMDYGLVSAQSGLTFEQASAAARSRAQQRKQPQP